MSIASSAASAPAAGVELEVVVRWLSSEVWKKVPCNVDGYTVDVILAEQSGEVHTIH